MSPSTTVVLLHGVDAALGEGCRELSAGGGGLFVSPSGDFDARSLEPHLRDVGANDRLLVVHVVHSTDPEALYVSMQRAKTDLTNAFPALRGVRQWVVQLAGLRWDEDEVAVAERVYRDANALSLGGVLVAGRATSASVAQPEEEERTAGTEVIHALRTCPALESALAERPAVWLVGIASVWYSIRSAAEEWSRRCFVAVLGQLLEPLQATDSAFGTGRRRGTDLELSNDREQARLARNPSGGSVLSEVRASAALTRTDFDRIPIGDWPAAVEAAVDEVRIARLPRMFAQVNRNVQERTDELRDELDRAINAYFAESPNIASTAAYVEGLLQAIVDASGQLLQRRGEQETETSSIDYDRLRRLSEHMPQAAALLARAFLGAILAILLVVSPISVWAHLDGADTRFWARIAGASVITGAALLIASRWGRLRRARDAAIRAAERDAVERVERYVLDARIRMLGDLAAHLARTAPQDSDSWLDRLTRLDRAAAAARRRCEDWAAHPGGGTGRVSRFSLRLPLAPRSDPQSRAAAEDAAAAAITAAIIRERLNVTEDDLVGAAAVAGAASYEPLFDESLREHLEVSDEAAHQARTVLRADLASAIGDERTGTSKMRVLRYLCVPDGTASGLTDKLNDEVSEFDLDTTPVAGVTGTLPSSDQNFLALVHALDVSAVLGSEAVAG